MASAQRTWPKGRPLIRKQLGGFHFGDGLARCLTSLYFGPTLLSLFHSESPKQQQQQQQPQHNKKKRPNFVSASVRLDVLGAPIEWAQERNWKWAHRLYCLFHQFVPWLLLLLMLLLLLLFVFFCFDKVRRRSGHPVDFFAKHVLLDRSRVPWFVEKRKEKKNEKWWLELRSSFSTRKSILKSVGSFFFL